MVSSVRRHLFLHMRRQRDFPNCCRPRGRSLRCLPTTVIDFDGHLRITARHCMGAGVLSLSTTTTVCPRLIDASHVRRLGCTRMVRRIDRLNCSAVIIEAADPLSANESAAYEISRSSRRSLGVEWRDSPSRLPSSSSAARHSGMSETVHGSLDPEAVSTVHLRSMTEPLPRGHAPW